MINQKALIISYNCSYFNKFSEKLQYNRQETHQKMR